MAGAALILVRDLYTIYRLRNQAERTGEPGDSRGEAPGLVRWKQAGRLALAGAGPWLLGCAITLVPAGSAAVVISQISGALPGTLYPGVHLLWPLVQGVEIYSTRESLFTTGGNIDPVKKKPDFLTVQTTEGLDVGLAVTVRYRLDPSKLHYIHTNLPQPVERELVPVVVAAAFRELAPNYLVRDVFSARREEIRRAAAGIITRKLNPDGIIVKEVLLRDIQLPVEYARGLESLLVKEQQNEKLTIETEVKKKEVITAGLEGEAQKQRQIKEAEARAATTVLDAKAQADAMAYTLPLKEKQIEQTRLESQARKEATVQNAEALAQAKVIDGKAELEKRKLMNEADSHRIRNVALADSERMKLEAEVMRAYPQLIQKIMAEKLSDKMQIMIVPSDGKFFLTDQLMRGMAATAASSPAPAPVQQQ